MKASAVFVTAVATLSTYVSAWPYPHLLDNPLPMERIDALYRRQDNNNNGGSGGDGGSSSNSGPAPTITDPPPSDQPSGTSSGDTVVVTGSGSGTGSQSATDGPQSGTQTESGNSTGTITKGPTHTPSVDIDAPVGLGSMINPDPRLGSNYYRLGDKVTWTWNYTLLEIPPTAIDILLTTSGTTAGQAPPTPFTLASNYSFAKTETFTWDTAKFTEQQFVPMGTYTMLVYDAGASGGMTARPEPGHLGLWNGFQFGIYSAQAGYQDWTGPSCVTCGAAGGQMERLTLSFLFGTFFVTAGSFLWFAGPLAGVL